MRLASAAALSRANLRCLLDGIPPPDPARVSALRRRAPRFARNRVLGPVPRLPYGAAAVCPRRFLRRVPGPHARGHPHPQIRSPAPGIRRTGPYARRSYGATRRRSSGRDAGDSRAAAPLEVRAARIQPVAFARRRSAGIPAQEPSANGGSRSRRVHCFASAPPKARPGSLPASAARMYAAHSWFPILRA